MPAVRAAVRAGPCRPVATLVGALVFAALSGTAVAAPAGSAEFEVSLDGATIGRASWRWSEVAGAESYEESLRINVQQAGTRAQLGYKYRFARRPGSAALEFSREIELGDTRQFDRGRIEAGKLHIEESSLRESRSELPLAEGAVMPYQRVRRMHEESASRARSTSVEWFDLDMLQVILARCRSAGPPWRKPRPELRPGRAANLGALPERWQFDPNGTPLSVEKNFAHMPLLLKRCDGRCPVSVQSLDLLGRLVVDSPLKLTSAQMQRPLRFRFRAATASRPSSPRPATSASISMPAAGAYSRSAATASRARRRRRNGSSSRASRRPGCRATIPCTGAWRRASAAARWTSIRR